MTRRIVTRCALAALLGLCAWSMAAHWLGWRFAMGIWPVPPGTGWPYQFESGFLPSLTVLSLLTLVGGAYHVRNCHSERCWRLGKHKIAGTPWCTRHLPEGRAYHGEVTLADVCERLDTLIALMTPPR
jgi:hypothetical protein